MTRKTFAVLFMSLFVFYFAPFAHATSSDLGLVGSATLTETVGVATPVTGIQITGTTPSTTPVKLLVSNGTLSLGTTTGLTFTSGGATGSTLYFTGTLANINNALATLTYTRNSTGTDTLEVSLVNYGEVFFPNNGHLYKFISGSIDWNTAVTAATGLTAYGATGYLATITSSAENAFISPRISADGWIGASDSAVEGQWTWVTGPEAGTLFWSGEAAGSVVPGQYANWNGSEPNNSGGNENCAEYYSGTSRWNDLPCSGNNLSGYMAEFGSPGQLPTVVAETVSITTTSAPTLSIAYPADDATNVNTATSLVLTFSQAMTIGTGNILVKKTSDNTTVDSVDVTSGAVTGGGTTAITVALPTPLTDSTGYYVQVPGTAFHNVSNSYYAGIADTTSWNFTTGDYTAPTVVSIASSTPDGAYTVGAPVTATVTFSEPVTTTGSVTVHFLVTPSEKTCTFTVSNATSGSCTYTIGAGDTAAHLDAFISGTIKDGNNNTLFQFSPASALSQTSAIVVDTTAPVLTQTVQLPSTIAAQSTTYSFSSSESGTYTLSDCGNGSHATISPGSAVVLTGLVSGNSYTCALYLTDAAGNVSNTLTIGPFAVFIRMNSGAPSGIVHPVVAPAAVTPAASVSSPTGTNSVSSQSTTGIHLFETNMKQGSTISDVVLLQELLKGMGPSIYPEGLTTGYFGPATSKAVVRFQEKYSEEILAPLGQTKGTGHVFEYTRNKLNNLLLAGKNS